MEMTLNLTHEDGMKMVEAMKEVAIESGWEADELHDCGVLEEYSNVVDAVLSAIGIHLNIKGAPSDEHEDESFDEDDFDFDNDEEDYHDDGDDEDGDDTAVDSLSVKMELILNYMKVGCTFEEACEIADILFVERE